MNIIDETSHCHAEYLAEKVDSTTERFVFPTSYAQQGLWLLDRLTGVTVSYIIPNVFRFQGRLDARALEVAFNEIILRHEALRTCFVEQDGAPVQVIHSALSIPLTMLDLSEYSEQRRASELERLIQANNAAAFDLAKLPLLRAKLLRLGEEEHIFLLAFHHIISDGWSMDVFARELSALYEAFSRGRPSPLPELPIQYADYAVWQREELQGEAMEQLLGYWKARLADAPTLELPTDKPRPAVRSFRGKSQRFNWSPDLTEGLKAVSQREGVTLFMTLVTAFQILLHRYSGQDDIAIGMPTAGRSRLELEGLIGFFVNILVLRTDLSGNPSFRELLAQVRKDALGAYANQDMPFEKLVEAFNPQHDRSRNPLFQVLFVLQNTPNSKLQLNEITVEDLQVDNGSIQFDLTLELTETPHGMTGRVKYATDLFEAATIDRLIGHFRTLLEGIVAHPESRLSDLPLLTGAERHQLLIEWNNTAASFPRDKCIHELFEAQAAATPQAVAVVYEDNQLTYAELNAQANRLAHHLREMGVKPDTLVAICVERCLNMVVGLLAIIKAGGAYLPLDPVYPKDRLAFMLEDSTPQALLTQSRLKSLFEGMTDAVPVIDIDMEPDFTPWASQLDTNLDRHAVGLTPIHLAYVIYTSGSTGQPKGVMVSHRNAVHSTIARFVNYKEPVTTYLLLSSFAFDSSVAGLFWTLGQGGCLCLPTDVIAKDPAGLAELIASRRVSHLLMLPSFYALLLKQGGAQLQTLKIAIVAGEACSSEVVKLHYTVLPDIPLYNEYGPTEGSVWSSVYLASQDDLDRPLSIGRPISNVRLYIMDHTGNLVPIGVQGELHIGGEGVVRGYWNRPELTAERFVFDPFKAEADAKIYKTGDLARWRTDGNIEFQGRNDFQVKIRGFRIELGEIEAALRQHPLLREVMVGMYEPVPGDKRLAAYLVPQDAPVPTASELRDFLKPKLPEFMIPSAFVFLDALPLSPNGKLNLKALPALLDENISVTYSAPRNETERKLVDIWDDLLGMKNIGIQDDFFDLGGHSLLAVKAVVEVNKLFNTNLPLSTIYQSPTVEELGIIISSGKQQPSWYSLVPIQTQGSRPPLFAIHTISLSDLPRHLGKDQPLYFLRYGMAAEISNCPVRLPLLEDLASHYIKEMQQVQPNGPYYLLGFSFGGMIAYEMACQLLANGHRVNLVGLLDTHLTSEKQLLPLHRIIYNFFRQSPSQLLAVVKSKITDLVTSYKYGTDFWPHIYTSAPDIACRNGFRLKSYNGQIILFQGWEGESKLFSYAPPPSEQEWKKSLGDRLEVQQITGKHIDMLKEPHVRILAEKLIACMDKAANSG